MVIRSAKFAGGACISVARMGLHLVKLLANIAFQYLYQSFIQTTMNFAMTCIQRFVLTPALFVLLFPLYILFQCAVAASKLVHGLIVLTTKRKFIYMLFDYLFSYDSLLSRAVTGVDDRSWVISSSSISNSTNNSEVQPFVERCSICFDSKLDLCLEQCRDQFCLDCFRNYITEVVKSSWGLSITVINCPVCRVPIPLAEWKRYVSESTIKLYEKYNQPYRSFSKHCPACETEVTPCKLTPMSNKPGSYRKGLSKLIAKDIVSFYERFSPEEQQKGHDKTVRYEVFPEVFTKLEWRISTLPEIHYQLMKALLHLSNTKEEKERVRYISLQILQLEVPPETWKRMQFEHIYFFPNARCPTCATEFCLQCGEYAHVGMSCEQLMEKILREQEKEVTSDNKNEFKSLEWKLHHSRRCPSCSMMINRDEGCNKVDCTYCGYSFCWQCKSFWSEDCGFFLCAFEKRSNTAIRAAERTTSSSITANDGRTELGVPNLDRIHTKLREKSEKQ